MVLRDNYNYKSSSTDQHPPDPIQLVTNSSKEHGDILTAQSNFVAVCTTRKQVKEITLVLTL